MLQDESYYDLQVKLIKGEGERDEERKMGRGSDEKKGEKREFIRGEEAYTRALAGDITERQFEAHSS